MRPPCELVQREFLPALRARLALNLSQRGLAQSQIADSLEITQAAVSKYLSQKIGTTDSFEEIATLSDRLASMIVNEKSASDQLVKAICSECMLLRIGSGICQLHQEKIHSLKEVNCQICTDLLGGSNEEFQMRADLLGDMRSALQLIERSPGFALLIPQVRANLVACGEDAKLVNQVVGVPGRITTIQGQARALLGPQFGASRHTAELLLWAKDTWIKTRACLCISGKEAIVTLVEEKKCKVVGLQDSAMEVKDIIKSIGSIPKSSKTNFIGVHVPGGIGVEPILYLFGPSAVALVEFAIELCELSKSSPN
ncbi:MAG: thiamine-phosphate synthase family protein [Candidatus Thorarchaeota archaeon]